MSLDSLSAHFAVQADFQICQALLHVWNAQLEDTRLFLDRRSVLNVQGAITPHRVHFPIALFVMLESLHHRICLCSVTTVQKEHTPAALATLSASHVLTVSIRAP